MENALPQIMSKLSCALNLTETQPGIEWRGPILQKRNDPCGELILKFHELREIHLFRR